jgi:hypothetical protein
MKSFRRRRKKDNGKEIHQFMIQTNLFILNKWGIKTSNNVKDFHKKNGCNDNETACETNRDYLEILHMFGAHMKRDW